MYVNAGNYVPLDSYGESDFEQWADYQGELSSLDVDCEGWIGEVAPASRDC